MMEYRLVSPLIDHPAFFSGPAPRFRRCQSSPVPWRQWRNCLHAGVQFLCVDRDPPPGIRAPRIGCMAKYRLPILA